MLLRRWGKLPPIAVRSFAQRQSPTHFELLGSEPKFDIDQAALNAKYLELQKQYHPDRYAQAPAGERQAASTMAAVVNGAYSTLMNPHSRARYLLSLNGRDVECAPQPPMDFLAEIMDVMELLSDPELDERTVVRLEKSTKKSLEEVLSQLNEAFQKADWDGALSLTGKLKYLINLRESIGEKKMGGDYRSMLKH
eukprot:TRINITY_DN69807_c0_g1_i1.p1 TRINITY_DN69807_c0_g1~~TRINITY_DN69807_c0_g1_i1.p1  ORF type:complete len:195 (+),score=33.37 TRINITY_DN69807_c0_g1_i1:28-612(+)